MSIYKITYVSIDSPKENTFSLPSKDLMIDSILEALMGAEEMLRDENPGRYEIIKIEKIRNNNV